jgi:hypothetical protein
MTGHGCGVLRLGVLRARAMPKAGVHFHAVASQSQYVRYKRGAANEL